MDQGCSTGRPWSASGPRLERRSGPWTLPASPIATATLVRVDAHQIRTWRVQRLADGSAVAEAACSCGWSASAGPATTLVGADLELQVAWADHAGPAERASA